MLRARRDTPAARWEHIGAAVGLSANACAQTHVRAVAKLRVFVLVCRPALCGGAPAVAGAFELACARPVDPLTPAERAVFEAVVLRRADDPTARGNWAVVQSACAKVAAHLAPDPEELR